MEKSSRDKPTDVKETSEAYRVPGADKILDTDLQTSRVLWFLFGLFGTRHDECFG